jgi:transposase
MENQTSGRLMPHSPRQLVAPLYGFRCRANILVPCRVRLQNQLEALLEAAHIKLSSLVSDLLGVSARRMLNGETDPAALAALADQRLRATPEQLQLLKMALADLQMIEQQIDQLDQEMASLLREHQDAVERLAEVPGLESGFGTIDHCRGGCQGSDLRFSLESVKLTSTPFR